MANQNIIAQEDWAFDKLDALLDDATWKRNLVVLKPNRSILFCYSVAQLRNELMQLAEQVVHARFKQCDADLKPVIENLIEEFDEEISKTFMLSQENKQYNRQRFKKAQ